VFPKSDAGGPRASQKQRAKDFPSMSKPVADTTLADPLLPPPHFLPLQPATVASTAQEHWPRRPSQGVCSKHLG